MLLTDACNENDDWAKHILIWVQAAFLMAGIWALGGTLSYEFREVFDQFYKDIWKGKFISTSPLMSLAITLTVMHM